MISLTNYLSDIVGLSDTHFLSLEKVQTLSQINNLYIHPETNSVTARLQKHQNSLRHVGHKSDMSDTPSNPSPQKTEIK